jgi:hypothetical protein
MAAIKKEIVYTMPYQTEKDIEKAQRKRQRLYQQFKNVQVYCNGLTEIRIVATDKIK